MSPIKKIMLTAAVMLTAGSGIRAQQRNCGTMENLELRKKANPSLEQKMADDEMRIQQWISSHPANRVPVINYPRLENFAPTGNPQQDAVLYATAKEAWVHANGLAKKELITDEAKAAQLREQKKKRNAFLTR